MVGWLNGVLVLYALLMLGGGIGAYMAPTIRSTSSLIAGVAAGVVLLGSVALARSHPRAGYGIAAAATLALAIFWLWRYMQTQRVMPAMAMLGLSVIVLLAILAGQMAIRQPE
jgi:uncharacterized membrane protein (UPF0136 family)